MTVDVRIVEGVIRIARDAARRILAVYDTAFDVEHKADSSPLTAADLASHHCIVDGLHALTPDIPVLSEESADAVAAAQRRQWDTLWVVDPLDGTREFVKRNGEFTVNIALVRAGEAVFGVIQQPATGALWHGARGMGAHRRVLRPFDELRAEDERETDVAIRTRMPANGPLRVAASRSHRDARTEAFLQRMGETEPLPQGSSLKFCRIAEGALDVYPRFGPTSEWDTAAGQAIVEAAGGQVLDPRGRPLRYNQRDTVLNGDFIALGDPALPWRDWL